MYDNFMWWLLVMTPAVLTMTYFIFKVECRGAMQALQSGRDHRTNY
jgi:hypothetical protein